MYQGRASRSPHVNTLNTFRLVNTISSRKQESEALRSQHKIINRLTPLDETSTCIRSSEVITIKFPHYRHTSANTLQTDSNVYLLEYGIRSNFVPVLMLHT